MAAAARDAGREEAAASEEHRCMQRISAGLQKPYAAGTVPIRRVGRLDA
jgi:hypothetical protein